METWTLSASGAVKRMSKEVQAMLTDALDSYIKRDAALADEAMRGENRGW